MEITYFGFTDNSVKIIFKNKRPIPLPFLLSLTRDGAQEEFRGILRRGEARTIDWEGVTTEKIAKAELKLKILRKEWLEDTDYTRRGEAPPPPPPPPPPPAHPGTLEVHAWLMGTPEGNIEIDVYYAVYRDEEHVHTGKTKVPGDPDYPERVELEEGHYRVEATYAGQTDRKETDITEGTTSRVDLIFYYGG